MRGVGGDISRRFTVLGMEKHKYNPHTCFFFFILVYFWGCAGFHFICGVFGFTFFFLLICMCFLYFFLMFCVVCFGSLCCCLLLFEAIDSFFPISMLFYFKTCMSGFLQIFVDTIVFVASSSVYRSFSEL